MKKNRKKIFVHYDKFLVAFLAIVLALHYTGIISPVVDEFILTFFSSIATLPVFLSAYQSLKNKKVNIDLLASVALIVSLLNKEWASAVFINLMLTSARIFAAYTENRSRNAIKSLLKLRPEKVKIKRGNEVVYETVSKIKKGDLVVIELGERIPVDGKIIQGEAMIDQSSLTGESLAVRKKINDTVLSSTLNVSGSIVVRAEKVGKDTTLEKIIKLVDQSQKDKIGIKTLADKFAVWYILVIVLGSAALYFYSRDLKLVLAILLVTCADDIAVAVPMAFSATIGRAAKLGIIIKGGAFLEGLTKVKTLLLDKTGTITKGKMHVADVVSANNFSQKETLSLAASAEVFSEHPVAKAIINYADSQKIKFSKPTDFKEFSGKGSTAIYKGKKIVCGRAVFFNELGIKLSNDDLKIIEPFKKDESKSILFVSYDGQMAGFITLEDEIRPEVKESIERLREYGIENIVMLTGDNENVAKRVADEIGLTQFHANLLPEDKLKYIKSYLNDKSKVAMVGDGVNDAAALALSDIGIAMGAIGTDTAIEAADIALMKDDFSRIPDSIQLGIMVSKIARENFVIWGVINAIGLLLAFGRIIGPEGAAAFNFITDFIPILNSLRLFRYKFKLRKI
jgi:heavy metal translocating P-type ATPase